MSSLTIDGLRFDLLQLNNRVAFDFQRQLTILWSPSKAVYQVVDAECQIVFQHPISDKCLDVAVRTIWLKHIARLNNIAQA